MQKKAKQNKTPLKQKKLEFWNLRTSIRKRLIEYIQKHPNIIQKCQNSTPYIFGISVDELIKLNKELSEFIYSHGETQIKASIPFEAISHHYVPFTKSQEVRKWLKNINAPSQETSAIISLEKMDKVCEMEKFMYMCSLGFIDKQSENTMLGQMTIEIIKQFRAKFLIKDEIIGINKFCEQYEKNV